MMTRIKKDLSRRRADKIRFFFRAVGMHIRKRRKELNLTQESLAKGICSNTYVSKMETNSIAVNEDSLLMIMERMELEYSLEMNVDEQLRLFDQALDCFIDGDYEGVGRVDYEVRHVEFAILTDLCRMVRDVVVGDVQEIAKVTDGLSRFMESMDHYTFGVFMLYAAAGMIAVGRPGDAIDVLEELEKTEFAYAKLTAMCEYLKMIGYGRTGRFAPAFAARAIAEAAFLRTSNYRRIAELGVYALEFDVAQGLPAPVSPSRYPLLLLDGACADRYHLLRAIGGADPRGEIALIHEDSAWYAAGQFVRGRHCLGIGDAEGFKDSCARLEKTPSPTEQPDFAMWLGLLGGGDDVALKDFLIAAILPYAERISCIPLMARATDAIVTILRKRKRYKDALQYVDKLNKFVRGVSRTTAFDPSEAEDEDGDSTLE